jgi:hypothetical protein
MPSRGRLLLGAIIRRKTSGPPIVSPSRTWSRRTEHTAIAETRPPPRNAVPIPCKYADASTEAERGGGSIEHVKAPTVRISCCEKEGHDDVGLLRLDWIATNEV